MAINLKPVDVAVVGLGAAGGVAVLPLARAGLKVAGIEAGSWMKPSDFKPDEIHNNVRRLVTTGTKVWKEIPTFRTGPDQPARKSALPAMMNAVGGTSIHYYANSWRFHPWDFQVRSETIKRYGAGAIPNGSTVEDCRSPMAISNRSTTPSSTKSAFPAKPATFRARSIPRATFSRGRGSANIRCLRCAIRISRT
jgi:choline dehydrogenase-like flavoprotein